MCPKVSGDSELTLRIIMHKQEQSTGNDGSILALKPNWSPKRRAPVAAQNSDLSQKNFFLKIGVETHWQEISKYRQAYFCSLEKNLSKIGHL